MWQALLNNPILLLVIATSIPLMFFGVIGTYFQNKEERLIDERMRLQRFRAWRDTFYLFVSLGVLLVCCSVFLRLSGKDIPADTAVLLTFIFVCGLSFFIADCIVRGAYVGRKETPILYMSQGLLFSACSFLFFVEMLVFNDWSIKIPLTFGDPVILWALMIFTICYACACWVRYIAIRKELSESEETEQGGNSDE